MGNENEVVLIEVGGEVVSLASVKFHTAWSGIGGEESFETRYPNSRKQ